MTPAAEARLIEMPAPAKVTTITDADLLFLLPPTSAVNRNAVILFNYVKALSGGRRRRIFRDRTLWENLGWSESMYRRAKKALIGAGLPIRHRCVRGELAPSEWLLDRRLVERLQRSEETPRGVKPDTTYTDENALGGNLPSVGSPPRAVQGRASPPERTADGATAPDAAPVTDVESDAPPPGEPPAALSWPVMLLEQWLSERFELGSEEGRAQALVALPEAMKWCGRQLSAGGAPSISAHIAGRWLVASWQSGYGGGA